MPSRHIVAKNLADIFKVIAHPDRIRLIEELRGGERDVNSLAKLLGVAGPRVSQHLALLRAHSIVEERRDGRTHYYRLTQPEIAQWIVEGLAFLEGRRADESTSEQIAAVRRLWASGESRDREAATSTRSGG
ncbi:MAG: helix-turn-helix transcriptional regulator [Pseudomonadales bacterium]|nr:helix-turn-helix transcriptional regulator [Pseudomonadales bacterium]MCP5183221.1 helix-turn-helix transcriptional regulator [Pseudomonadales bacterium]